MGADICASVFARVGNLGDERLVPGANIEER